MGSPNLRDPFAGLPAWLVPCDEHPRGQLLKGALGHVVPFVLIVIALFFATGADGIADLIF